MSAAAPALQILSSDLRAFVRTYARMQRQSVRELEAAGTGFARCLILTELRSAGPLSQKELGERLEIEKSGLSRVVRTLLDAKLVVRRPHERDGRISLIALTAKGERHSTKLDCELDLLNNRLLSRLNESDRQAVARGLECLRGALKRDAEEAACKS